MEYLGVNFDAIVATPCCGKSFLCDKYPDLFVDVDEERLKCKYNVPENITRTKLEETKGNRNFTRRLHGDEFLKELYKKLDLYVKQGKTLILAPHGETIKYLKDRNIKFCFVFPKKTIKNEIIARMIGRKNPQETIQQNSDMFDEFYEGNIKEHDSVVHYEFDKDEYLEDIIFKKFNYKSK